MLKASYRLEIERAENAHLDRTVVRDGCASALESYWDTEDPGTVVVAPDGLERAVPATLRGLPFVGYVDRLSETDLGLRVTDYKTGSGKPRYWWPKWRQQLLYAAALEYADQPVAEVQLLFLKDARAVTRPAYPAAVSRSLSELEQAHEERSAMMQSSVWEARPSPLCNYCDFREVCPGVRSKSPQPGSSTSDARLVELGLTKRVDDWSARAVPA
jgi:putative RecB family exonuclease